MEGNSLKLDALQKVPEPKKKKKVPGWSTEEMKERPNVAVEGDTEEMKRWRSLNQSEMDLCFKNFWLRKWSREVLDKYKGQREQESEMTLWNGEEWEKVRDIKLVIGEKTAGQDFSPSLENTTCSVCKASMRNQQKRRR